MGAGNDNSIAEPERHAHCRRGHAADAHPFGVLEKYFSHFDDPSFKPFAY